MKATRIATITGLIIPTLALLIGYNGQKSAQAEAPVYSSPEKKKIYVIQHYKLAEPEIVVTVNTFPFDVGGSRPYQINVQGQRYVFKPEDVKQFLKLGRPMKQFTKPLPSGMVFSDGLDEPVYLKGEPSEPSDVSVLRLGPPEFPPSVGRTR